MVAMIAAAAALPAHAADNTLLIQIEPDGRYKVWHTEGATHLDDEELLDLAASARPEGGETQATSAGPARAFAVKEGVLVVVADAPSDKTLLIDRDECGGVKLWHSEGATQLTDEQLTELVLSALPGGGKNLRLGENLAKAFAGRIGVTATIWKPAVRR